jgi:hypothetical protein
MTKTLPKEATIETEQSIPTSDQTAIVESGAGSLTKSVPLSEAISQTENARTGPCLEWAEKLFDLWERNVTVVRSVARCGKRGEGADLAKALVEHFKDCARSHAKSPDTPATEEGQAERSKIDKSVLTIGEPKRIWSKEHLRHVASQPCLICARSPAHAHHLRFAQPKGLGLKVSDEFTVPRHTPSRHT